jgi:hypothetical protein
MTDSLVRRFFKGIFGGDLFSAYGDAFRFLRVVQADMNEAIDTICNEEDLTRSEATDYLQNAHGRKRSLVKLADEYYYTLCHQSINSKRTD